MKRDLQGVRGLFVAVLLLVVSVPLYALDFPTAWSSRPLQPSRVDQVHLIVGLDQCPPTEADTSRTPTIQLDGQEVVDDGGNVFTYYLYSVSYHVNVDNDVLCPQIYPPPPQLTASIAIGDLPVGYHQFYLTGYNQDDQVAESGEIGFWVTDRPDQSLSGAWYSPRQSGRGMMVNRYTTWDGENVSRQFAIYWAMHDPDGEASWVVAQGDFVDNHFEVDAYRTEGTPLASGPASLPQTVWGTLSLEYQGCGSMLLSWHTDDPSIEDGSEPQQQLAMPDGVAGCLPGLVNFTYPAATWPIAD